MSLIDFALTKPILWKKRKRGSSGSSAGEYERARVIASRVQETSSMAAGPAGREIRTVNEIYVTQDVQIGDLINWRDLNRNGQFEEVQGRSSYPGITGGIDHYVLSLEP